MEGMIIGLLLPLMGTMIGSGFVFFMKEKIPDRLQKTLIGFASGVMVAASVWSLLIPSMEINVGEGERNVILAVAGLIAGMGFLLLIDFLTPHLHIGNAKPEGLRSHLSRTAMLTLAVTIHNLPEGMAVGIVLAGALQAGSGITAAGAFAMALGIAIQNIPEGAIISMPMRRRQQPSEIVCHRQSERSRGANRRDSSNLAGLTPRGHNALYAGVRRRSDALCGG